MCSRNLHREGIVYQNWKKKPRKVKGHCEMELAGKECFVNICIDLKAASQVRNS